MERGSHLRLKAIQPNDTIPNLVRANVDETSVLMTDKASVYVAVGREYEYHGIVDHDKKEYVNGVFHTNTIEVVSLCLTVW